MADIFEKIEGIAGIALLGGVAYVGYVIYQKFFGNANTGSSDATGLGTPAPVIPAPGANDKTATDYINNNGNVTDATGQTTSHGTVDDFFRKLFGITDNKVISPPGNSGTPNPNGGATISAAPTGQASAVGAYFSGQSSSYGGLSDVLAAAKTIPAPTSNLNNITPAATVNTQVSSPLPSSMTLQQQKAAGLPYFANGKWNNK
jgi:hypothetical protein